MQSILPLELINKYIASSTSTYLFYLHVSFFCLRIKTTLMDICVHVSGTLKTIFY